MVPADQAGAFAEDGDRLLPWPCDSGSSSFSLATRQLSHSAWSCRLSMRVPFSARRCADDAGQRQIDIVAAQQDVLAHRDALQRQLAVAFGHRDQGEVGGAAADVDHQNQVAEPDALAPVGVPFDPGVERGLRLFEQRDVLVAGLLGGLLA